MIEPEYEDSVKSLLATMKTFTNWTDTSWTAEHFECKKLTIKGIISTKEANREANRAEETTKVTTNSTRDQTP